MDDLYDSVLSCDWNGRLQFQKLLQTKPSYRDADEYFRVMKRLVAAEFIEELKQNTKEVLRYFSSSMDIMSVQIGETDDHINLIPRFNTNWTRNDVLLLVMARTRLYGIVQDKKFKDGIATFTIRIQKESNIFPVPFRDTFQTRIAGYFVGNLTDACRQTLALIALKNCPLSSAILSGTSTVYECDKDEVTRTQQTYSINEPQADAVVRCLNIKGLNMIRGPPGTGKTKTIASILAASLNQRQANEKFLACAASNVAVDNIAARITSTWCEAKTKAQIVRIGKISKTDEAVYHLTVEYMVLKELGIDDPLSFRKSICEADNLYEADASAPPEGSVRLEEALQTLSLEFVDSDSIEASNAESDSNVSDVAALGANSKPEHDRRDLIVGAKELIKRLQVQEQKYEKTKKSSVKSAWAFGPLSYYERKYEEYYNERFHEIIMSADVICSTLSSSALLPAMKVKTVIIDEATQCTEPTAIIPLQYGCTNCILVGDNKQLPPTVKSQPAAICGLNVSLFERICKTQKYTPNSYSFLSVQYRMHPEISAFPSQAFYDGLLKDAPSCIYQSTKPWHYRNELFGPCSFFQVNGVESSAVDTSLANCKEAYAVKSLVKQIQGFDVQPSIGVISPYSGQVKLMKTLLHKEISDGHVTVNSVDGFQGQEKDIIIFSCVRAAKAQRSIGFLNDMRRLNVALTRAKCSLWILGESRTLSVNCTWRSLLEETKKRGTFWHCEDHANIFGKL